MQEKILNWERKIAQQRIIEFSDSVNIHKFKYKQAIEKIEQDASLENLAELYKCIATIRFLPSVFAKQLLDFNAFCKKYKIRRKLEFKKVINGL